MSFIERGGSHLFSNTDLAELKTRKFQEIAETVGRLKPTEITENSISIFVANILSENKIDSLEIDFENPTRSPAREASLVVQEYGEVLRIPATEITINFIFSGSPWLLNAFGSMRTSSPPKGIIAPEIPRLGFSYIVPQSLPQEKASRDLLDMLERDKSQVKLYVDSVNKAITEYNDQIAKAAEQEFRRRLERIGSGRQLAELIGIPLERRPAEEVKIFHPHPSSLKATPTSPPNTRTQTEWRLANEDYDYILSLMEQMVLMMERSPRTFEKMQEEELRDIILVILNAHFKGQATGETFNFNGKTDILIRHEGRNVFIAECKFWKGPKSLSDAIDQILRYTAWRDTKAALVIFNRQGNFSSVLRQIPETVKSHPAHRNTLAGVSDTHFRFLLRHPSDPEREILLAALAFEVPSVASS